MIDPFAFHIFERKPGQAMDLAAVNQPGDVRMLEPGQNLSLIAKSAGELTRIASKHKLRLDQFDRDLLLILGIVAHCEPHRTHPAEADFAQQAVWPEAFACLRRDRRPGLGVERNERMIGDDVFGRSSEGIEQRRDLLAQFAIVCAGLRQELGTRGLLTFEGSVKKFFDLRCRHTCSLVASTYRSPKKLRAMRSILPDFRIIKMKGRKADFS